VNGTTERTRRPLERGPRSAALLEILTADPTTPIPSILISAMTDPAPPADPLLDDDLQLTLFLLYELHYRGIDGVDDGWEWNPSLLTARAALERSFEPALRRAASRVLAEHDEPGEARPDAERVITVLLAMTEPSSKPGLAAHLARRADLDQYRELLINRSVYHLKEADPHTFAIPRLSGAAKAALVEIQSDEYGNGRPEWVHATLFARSMTALGLNTRYGHYLDRVPAVTLANANAMSLFGLHRRLRGAVVGHLAAFEMTSTQPNRQYAQGLRRLGLGDDAAAYFDEHVEADAVHEQIALRDLAGGLVGQEPELAADVLFGAAAALALDEATSRHLLDSWTSGQTGLREPGVNVSARIPAQVAG
jgi:heme oxygenase-like protein